MTNDKTQRQKHDRPNDKCWTNVAFLYSFTYDMGVRVYKAALSWVASAIWRCFALYIYIVFWCFWLVLPDDMGFITRGRGKWLGNVCSHVCFPNPMPSEGSIQGQHMTTKKGDAKKSVWKNGQWSIESLVWRLVLSAIMVWFWSCVGGCCATKVSKKRTRRTKSNERPSIA